MKTKNPIRLKIFRRNLNCRRRKFFSNKTFINEYIYFFDSLANLAATRLSSTLRLWREFSRTLRPKGACRSQAAGNVLAVAVQGSSRGKVCWYISSCSLRMSRRISMFVMGFMMTQRSTTISCPAKSSVCNVVLETKLWPASLCKR